MPHPRTETPRPRRAPVRRERGPDLDGAFRVISGFVVLHGELDLTLPPGALWPGLRHVPEWMLDLAQPAETEQTPGALTTPLEPTPADINAGIALLHVQLLQTGQLLLADRQRVVQHTLDPLSVNTTTLARVIGATRESCR